MVAQGNMLGMIGDLVAANDHFARALAIFQGLGDRGNQAAMLERLGWIVREQGDANGAMAWLEECVALHRKLGDRQQIAWPLLTMAEVAVLREDANAAESLVDQGVARGPVCYDWSGWSRNHLGHVAQLRGDFERAEHLHQRGLAIFRERLGEKSTGVIWTYQGLGEAALGRGDPIAAREWLAADLRICHELGARILTAWCLAGLGGVAALQEEPELAAQLWGAAEHLRATLGCRPAPAARATYERLIAQVKAQIGESAFSDAWTAGQALALDQAIARALVER
jgi:tetratricopeptide (TPR) repeat protein